MRELDVETWDELGSFTSHPLRVSRNWATEDEFRNRSGSDGGSGGDGDVFLSMVEFKSLEGPALPCGRVLLASNP